RGSWLASRTTLGSSVALTTPITSLPWRRAARRYAVHINVVTPRISTFTRGPAHQVGALLPRRRRNRPAAEPGRPGARWPGRRLRDRRRDAGRAAAGRRAAPRTTPAPSSCAGPSTGRGNR